MRRSFLLATAMMLSLLGVILPATGLPNGAVPADATCPVANPATDPGPYFVTDTVPLPTGVHVVSNDVNVILPAGYCTSGDDYPVLYLLHGAGDTYQSWEHNTTLDSYITAHSAAYPFIIVMPDDGANAVAGWYSNWSNGAYQYETYDIDVLRPWIDANYRTRTSDLGIAGLSMGGFGAMSYAARHPGMFKVAASFSGAVDMLYGAPVSGTAFAELAGTEGTPGPGVWGNQVTNENEWAAHNPTSLAGALKGTTLLLASGTGTPAGPEGDALNPTSTFDPGGYLVENVIFQMNLAFTRALRKAGVAYTSHFYVGGYHGWPYWQADLYWALPSIANVLGGPVSG
ncbi:MAG: alpha/beta hydrolase [Acidimicrobiales bacterium]